MKDENNTKDQLINELPKSRPHFAELEVSETQHKGAEEAPVANKERASQSKTRTFHPGSRLIVSLVFATCIVSVVGHLLENSWLNVQKSESLPHHTETRERIANQPHESNESPDLGEPAAYAQADRKEGTQDIGDMSMTEDFSLQQGLYDKATSAVVHMPKAEASRAGRVVIQVGAFREKAKAELLLRKLGGKGYHTYLDARIVKNLGLTYRVRLQGYPSQRAARTAIGRLQEEEGLDDSFALTALQ